MYHLRTSPTEGERQAHIYNTVITVHYYRFHF